MLWSVCFSVLEEASSLIASNVCANEVCTAADWSVLLQKGSSDVDE